MEAEEQNFLFKSTCLYSNTQEKNYQSHLTDVLCAELVTMS